MSKNVPQKFDKVIQIDEQKIHQHLGDLVRGTVEETLDQLLDAEADQLCNVARYERSEARQDTRAGHYERSLHTKAGEVTLKVPKLREHKKVRLSPFKPYELHSFSYSHLSQEMLPYLNMTLRQHRPI